MNLKHDPKKWSRIHFPLLIRTSFLLLLHCHHTITVSATNSSTTTFDACREEAASTVPRRTFGCEHDSRLGHSTNGARNTGYRSMLETSRFTSRHAHGMHL
jgi:hypothetical protein